MTSSPINSAYTDIDRDMSQEAEQAILYMVRAWPSLESSLSEWLMQLANLAPDVGRIIIGNMDIKTKIDRLVMLSDHFKRNEEHAILKDIRSTYSDAANIRNTVIHTPFLGMLKSKPGTLLFGGKRHLQGERGLLRVEQVTIVQIHMATHFAFLVDEAIERILGESRSVETL